MFDFKTRDRKKLFNLMNAALDINRYILEVNDISKIFNYVLHKITACVKKSNMGCIMTFAKDGDLKIVSSIGYNLEHTKDFSIKLEENFYLLSNKGKIDKPIIINDIHKLNWENDKNYWKSPVFNGMSPRKHSFKILQGNASSVVKSSLSTPILLNNKLFGFINIDSNFNYAFTKTDLEVMEYIKYQLEVFISKNRLYEETVYLSTHDPLTKLFNRKFFEDSLHDAISKKQNFLLAIFDLNNLKLVNDSYGHLAGDEFIKYFSKNLKSLFPCDAILSRLGGDEFGGVFFNINMNHLIDSLEVLKSKFRSNPLNLNKDHNIYDFSYGISNFPNDSFTCEDLFKIADKRMYEYKHISKSIPLQA